INIFKKDSTYTSTNLTTKLKYDLRNWAYYIGYEKTESISQLNLALTQEDINNLNGNYLYIGTSFTDYKSDLLQPKNTYGEIKLTAGKRVTDINKDKQIKLELEGIHNFKLRGNHTIYMNVNLAKYWSKTYYTNENFK